MTAPTPFLRRLAGAACLALLATGLSPATPAAEAAGGHVPITAGLDDTVVGLRATSTLQLLKRPGANPKPWVAKAGTPRWVGKKPHGRPIVSRLYYTFDLSGLPVDAITQVILNHSQLYSPNHECFLDSYGPAVAVATTAAPGSAPRWPGPAVTSTGVQSGYAVGNRQACAGDDFQSWDVTEAVRSAAESSPVVHLRLASSDEHKKSGYRRYLDVTGTPGLDVYLRPHPDQPTHLTVDSVVPKSPASPKIVAGSTAGIRANLTTPGGCRGTTALFPCLAARYELTAPDGTVVSAGVDSPLSSTNGVADFVHAVGPMEEGVDYVAKVWGVNRQTGFESLQPATVTIRYNAPPGAPTVSQPQNGWRMGQPIQVTATAHDSDAKQLCWEIQTGSSYTLEGCLDITTGEATVVDLGTLNTLASLDGTLWVVDEYGTRGRPAIIQGAVTW